MPTSQRLLRTQINATKANFPNITLQQLFLDQVVKNPQAQAIVDVINGDTWTYKELFEHSYLTYKKLKEKGVKSGGIYEDSLYLYVLFWTLFDFRRIGSCIGKEGLGANSQRFGSVDVWWGLPSS